MFESTIAVGGAPQSPRSLAVSVAVHSAAVVLVFAVRFSSVVAFPGVHERVTLIAPVSVARPPKPRIAAPPIKAFHPIAQPHLELPRTPMIAAAPVEIPQPPKVNLPEPARIPIAAMPAMPVIKTAVFTEPKMALPPEPAPKPAVRAAGFESSGSSSMGHTRGTLSAVGSFDSSAAAEGTPAHKASATGGSAGFSSASGGSAPAAPPRAAIRNAAFGEAQAGRSPATPRATASDPITPVEILSKPSPAYTAEARAQKIEGEVLLEMQFSASGEARVLRLIRGLGHGLDESALAAAQGIRFRPARRDGAAVDSSAIVHIVFQLAN